MAEFIRVQDLPSLGIAWQGHGSGIRHLGPGVTCQETQHSWAPAPNFQQLRTNVFWRRKQVSRSQWQGDYFRGEDSSTDVSTTHRVPTRPFGAYLAHWAATLLGLCQSVAMLPQASHLLSLLLVIGTGVTVPSPRVPPQGCYVAEEAGERTFRCSQAGLRAVPTGIPNDTRKLYLDANQLASVPAGAFQHLPILEELDLSHNALAHLSGAAFQGLGGTLRRLDLSANQLASVPAEAFAGLHIHVNLSANPWRCDCALQEVLRQVRLVPGTGTGIVCGPGGRPDLVGQEFMLLEEELCGTGPGGARRSTDVALLVTMGGWLTLVVAYLVYYVWQNRDETRRSFKQAPVLLVRSEDSSTLSTMV
ncbi:leucine-rich repeat-containing protein 3C [Tupaia chinensis]|uniref:Leucine-rich repeat-containing protein 3C n=1 Tax=Tupaia chinensis TaxID=246437 RepID=L9JWN0_TUPCH|nr:leucine-rich repeat-containing protein 3C [Tupaia chinensis]ELW54896.1 Leucine-rich repeat-containing protein 3C [Tupaia chinensis]